MYARTHTGNLARATYVGSSNNMWPWSYNVCDRKKQSEQLISACNMVNHYNLAAYTGRGAPEIDLLEVMGGVEQLVNTPTNKVRHAPSRSSYVSFRLNF